MSAAQLLKVWAACTPFSRNAIYVHIVVLMACASVIFNAAMRLSDSFLLDFIGLILGLLLPPNLYFHFVFKDRRPAIRQFVQENQDEFRSE